MDQISRLREQIDELREENRQLRHNIGLIDRLPDHRKLKLIGMSESCFRIFALLERRSLVTKDVIFTALWDDNEPDWAESAVGVYLNRLRKVLARFEIKITNVRSVGWCLEDDNRKRAADLMKELTR